MLGANSPSVDGWGEVYVRLENKAALPLHGYAAFYTDRVDRITIDGKSDR